MTDYPLTLVPGDTATITAVEGTKIPWSVTARGSINSEADASIYSSASYTPLADRLLVLFAHYYAGSGVSPNNFTPSGNGLTWEAVTTHVSGGHRWSLWVAKTGAGPSAGALTITVANSQVVLGCEASVLEVGGANLSSTGLAAIAQSKFVELGSATSGSMSLTAAPASTGRCIALWTHLANESMTPRTNWTEVHDVFHANPNIGFQTQMRIDAAEQTTSASWATSTYPQCLAAEIKGAS